MNWEQFLKIEQNKSYYINLEAFFKAERLNFNIFPKESEVFKAFELTPLNQIKVVIIGQDPYHKINQAHGLSFSVNHGIKPPPSLINIYKELKSDLNIQIPKHGNLSNWAMQGVLLLNAILTVREGWPGSHQKNMYKIYFRKY